MQVCTDSGIELITVCERSSVYFPLGGRIAGARFPRGQSASPAGTSLQSIQQLAGCIKKLQTGENTASHSRRVVRLQRKRAIFCLDTKLADTRGRICREPKANIHDASLVRVARFSSACWQEF